MGHLRILFVPCKRCLLNLFSLGAARFSSTSVQQKSDESPTTKDAEKLTPMKPSQHVLPEKYEAPKENSIIAHSRTQILAQIEAGKTVKVPFRMWQVAIRKTYIPHQAYLDLNLKEREVYVRHMAAVQRRQLTYKDPQTKNQVMTVTALLLQEKCCGNACRHCPYGHENVPTDIRNKKVFNGAFYV